MGVVESNDKNDFTLKIRACAMRIKRDGVGALGELFDITASRLARYSYTITRSHEDAEDAIQAAMIRVAVKPRLLANSVYPWPYLMKIVRNESIRIARKRARLRLVEPEIATDSTVSKSAEEVDTKNVIRAAIARLPANQSEVVVLKIWEDMTFAEIADVLDESPNTVASRYRYAIDKLSRCLHSLHQEVQYE